MNGSTPHFPVLHHLPELAQTHINWVSDAIQPSHPLSPFPPAFNLSQHQGLILMSWLLASGGQSIGALASALPMNVQGWFPLGLTSVVSLQSKGLSRVFSNTTIQNINSSVLSLLYDPVLTSIQDYCPVYIEVNLVSGKLPLWNPQMSLEQIPSSHQSLWPRLWAAP